MNHSEPLLSARSVSFSRHVDGARQEILQATDLQVCAGEILAVVGPSGSGKSTLLRLFNRLLEPDDGLVLLAGQDVRSLPPPVLRTRVPLVAQKPFLFAGTVRDNLLTPARLRRSAPPDIDGPDILEILELCQVSTSWLDRDAQKLSIGQQQRVCVARSLIGPCQALLLDEPTSALDRPTADQLAQTFRRLARRRGLAMMLVTHDLTIAERCADQVALLLDGTVVEIGPADQVLHEPRSEAARRFLAAEPATREEGDE